MEIPKNVSAQSVADFRAAVARSFDTSGTVRLNLIAALAVGPRPGAPVEVSASAMFAYGHDSLSQALRRAAAARQMIRITKRLMRTWHAPTPTSTANLSERSLTREKDARR